MPLLSWTMQLYESGTFSFFFLLTFGGWSQFGFFSYCIATSHFYYLDFPFEQTNVVWTLERGALEECICPMFSLGFKSAETLIMSFFNRVNTERGGGGNIRERCP